MGATASVLSLPVAASFPGAATAIAGASGCFALGYLLALARLPLHAAAPDSGSGDDDSEDDSEEDDDENSGRSKTAKRAPARKRTGLRLLFWSRNVVTKSDSARETERAQAQTASAPLEIENLAKIIEDFKMVLVVRNDLKMGKGKIAAQCSHATLGLFKKLQQRAPKSLRRWERCGQVKVVVKVESEEDMLVLQGRAKSMNLPTHITIDAGRTQIAPNSRTVMAILGDVLLHALVRVARQQRALLGVHCSMHQRRRRRPNGEHRTTMAPRAEQPIDRFPSSFLSYPQAHAAAND